MQIISVTDIICNLNISLNHMSHIALIQTGCSILWLSLKSSSLNPDLKLNQPANLIISSFTKLLFTRSKIKFKTFTVKFLKISLMIIGVFFILVGLLEWSMALARKYHANWENWDGKLHFQTGLICSAAIAEGIIIIAIASKIRRKNSN
jgi:hypothetical protein